jgi:hypothetical protein
MTDFKEPSFIRRNWPMIFGASITIFVFLFFIGLGFTSTCPEFSDSSNCIPKWKYFFNAMPNEIGDTLAGFFSALAVVWLVVSVAQQSIELKNQREELRNLVAAQADQVKVLEGHAVVLYDQQRRINENRAYGQLVQANIAALEFSEKFSNHYSWTYHNKSGEYFNITLGLSISVKYGKSSRDDNISSLRDVNRDFIGKIEEVFSKIEIGCILTKPLLRDDLRDFVHAQYSMSDFIDDLSDGSKMRIARTMRKELVEIGLRAIHDKRLWSIS